MQKPKTSGNIMQLNLPGGVNQIITEIDLR